jgi:hypothetical protein
MSLPATLSEMTNMPQLMMITRMFIARPMFLLKYLCNDPINVQGELAMHISTYQVHNVLRAYGKQLSLSKRGVRNKNVIAPNQSDSITISAEARRKAVIEKVTSDIVERVVHFGPRDAMEQEAFRELENEYGNNLALEENNGAELVFKVIDKEKGEEIKTLSIEDSKLLKNRFEEITKKKVDATMF